MKWEMKRISLYIIVFTLVMAVTFAATISINSGPAVDGCPFVSYRVFMKDKELDLFSVGCRVYGTSSKETVFVPGYHHRARVMEAVDPVAKDRSGERLEVKRRGDELIVFHGGDDFYLEYDVVLSGIDRYKPEIGKMISFPGQRRLRMIGSDIFLIPDLSCAGRTIVNLQSCFPGDKISALPVVNGKVIVSDLENLATLLVGCGNYRTIKRRIEGVNVTMAIGGTWSFSDRQFFDLICEIVSREISIFGKSPYSEYIFLCDVNPVREPDRFDLYGIHIGNAMVLLLDREFDRSMLFDTPMSIVTHEFFHNWNGEILRPGSDSFLWFTEGVTVYFSYKILLDLNIISPRQYEIKRESMVEQYMENPYREKVPIASAANNKLDDKEMVNLLYKGGFLAAEALDRRIRANTGGKAGLIDILKFMFNQCETGCLINESTVVDAVLRMGGGDISGFLDDLVNTPDSEIISEVGFTRGGDIPSS